MGLTFPPLFTLVYSFSPPNEAKTCKTWKTREKWQKTLFQQANPATSTHSLVKIYKTQLIKKCYPRVDKTFDFNCFLFNEWTFIGNYIKTALVIGPASKGQVTALLAPRPLCKVDGAKGSLAGWRFKHHFSIKK